MENIKKVLMYQPSALYTLCISAYLFKLLYHFFIFIKFSFSANFFFKISRFSLSSLRAFSISSFVVLSPPLLFFVVFCFNSYPVIQKYVINPYYEQKGEVNPELADAEAESEDEEVLFEDKGGSEKPIEKKKNKKKAAKGKIIS